VRRQEDGGRQPAAGVKDQEGGRPGGRQQQTCRKEHQHDDKARRHNGAGVRETTTGARSKGGVAEGGSGNQWGEEVGVALVDIRGGQRWAPSRTHLHLTRTHPLPRAG